MDINLKMNVVGKPHRIPYRQDELVQEKCPGTKDTWYYYEGDDRRAVSEDRYFFSIPVRDTVALGACAVNRRVTGLEMEDAFYEKYKDDVGLYRCDPNHWYDFREPVGMKKKGERSRGDFRILELKLGTMIGNELRFCCGKSQFGKIMSHYTASAVKPSFIIGVKGWSRTNRNFVRFYRIWDLTKIRRVLVKKSPGAKKKLRVT